MKHSEITIKIHGSKEKIEMPKKSQENKQV